MIAEFDQYAAIVVPPLAPEDLPAGSWATNAGTRKSMQGNRSRDTSPEMAVRRLVHRAGYRYAIHSYPDPKLKRRADLVFTRRRIAVFIDGCFWHACLAHFVAPKSHVDYWNKKIARNQERDLDTTAQLKRAGWRVLRFWTHEDPAEIASSIIREVRRADRKLDGRAR